MKFLHCEISGRYKVITKHNPLSGHYWNEHVDMKGYRVDGGRLMSREFISLEKAKEAIQFDYDVIHGKFSHLKP